jgi:peptide deformylase
MSNKKARREAKKAEVKAAKKDRRKAFGLMVHPNHPALHAPTQLCTLADNVQEIADNMILALTHHDSGVGLAATQIGVSRRMIVIWAMRQFGETPIIMINPEYISKSEEMCVSNEGCLSFPGTYIQITRHEAVTVKFTTLAGVEETMSFKDFAAFVVQHEMDHLDGVCKVHLAAGGWKDLNVEKVRIEQAERMERRKAAAIPKAEASVTIPGVHPSNIFTLTRS